MVRLLMDALSVNGKKEILLSYEDVVAHVR